MHCLTIRKIFAGMWLVIGVSALSGCATYLTPGGAADFNLLADDDIKEILARKPATPFPANLAVARVQAPRYRSRTTKGYGQGRYSVVTVRDLETEADFDRIEQFPQIERVVGINRLLLTDHLESDRQLRQAAASVHADLIWLYTFDTSFFVGDALPPLSVITLGLSPNQQAKVTTTASGILLDVRTGYVYGSCETTSRKEQLASAWTSGEAVDFLRLKTERLAFEELLDEFERLWGRVTNQAKPQSTAAVRAEG